MILALQIAIGIWLGTMFVIGTVSLYMLVQRRAEESMGPGTGRDLVPWWRGLLPKSRT